MPSVYVGPVKPVSSVPVQYQAWAKLVGLPVQVPVEQTRGFPSASPRCTAISHVVWWSASSAMLPVVSTLPQLKSARRATCHMHDGSIFQILRRASRLLWSSPQLRPVLAAVRRCCTAATPLVMATALIPSVALGEGWTIRPTGLPTGINTGSLSSVSCLSATLCIAVGGASDFNGNVTNAVVLAEMWNGIGWIPMPVPGPSGDVPSLAGVSCLSATLCVAVGSVSPSSGSLTRPLAEAWNGTRWAPLSAKDPGTRYGARLSAVSCVSATDCEAVGTVFYPDRPYEIAHALVERWNGTAWRIVGTQTPTLGPHRGTSFSGVSCVAANACTAVGGVERAVPSANSTPLAERWNGRRWSIASVRHPAAALLDLNQAQDRG